MGTRGRPWSYGLLYLLTAFAVAACAPAKKPINQQSDLSSRAPEGQGPLASCNQFSNSILSGKVKAYFSAFGDLIESSLRLQINNISSEFDNNTDLQIQFFRIAVSDSGSIHQDRNPLQFRIEEPSFGNTTGLTTSISIDDITAFNSSLNINAPDATGFFKATQFVINGTDASWHILQIVVYEDGLARAESKALMPMFVANPDTYMQHHHSTLNQLHPFIGQAGQYNISEGDAIFESSAREFCF